MRSAHSLRKPRWPLRVLLAWLMVLTPLAPMQAQSPAAGKLDTKWLMPESVGVVYVRPRQILTAENAELLPLEILAATGKKYLGIDPIDVKSVTVVAEPMLGMQPFYAAVIESTKPFDKSGLSPEITAHTEQAEFNGRTYLKSREPMAPGFYQLNDTTLIVATEPMLQKIMKQGSGPKSSPLLTEIKDRPATDDLYVAVDVKTLRPLITMALAAQANEVPPEFQKYLKAPQFVRSAEFAFNFSAAKPPELNVYANDEQAAQALVSLIDQGMDEIRAQVAANLNMNQTDDLLEQAMMAYSARRTDQTLEALRPVRDGDKLSFFPIDPENPSRGIAQMQQAAVIGILVALLLPAVQAARTAARRNDSLAHLRDFAIALQNYHDTKGEFPAHASYSEDGKPLLSWRVHLLPYMEEVQLYRQFDLDEPWDSEHNKQLIAKMPDIFQSPSSPLERADGKTLYMAPIGKGFVMDGTKDGVGIRQITDGTSKTIVVVEANPEKAVIWTKPDDLKVDLENPADGLGGLYAGVFQAAFADGFAKGISNSLDPKILKGLFTRNGREVFNSDDLNP